MCGANRATPTASENFRTLSSSALMRDQALTGLPLAVVKTNSPLVLTLRRISSACGGNGITNAFLFFARRGRNRHGAIGGNFRTAQLADFVAAASGEQQQFQTLRHRLADRVAGFPERNDFSDRTRRASRLLPAFGTTAAVHRVGGDPALFQQPAEQSRQCRVHDARHASLGPSPLRSSPGTDFSRLSSMIA